MSPQGIYFDHAATTPVHPEVVEAMLPFLREGFANPSSIHTAGRQVRKGVNEARDKVAGLIGANPEEIVFTSGGTESNTTAIFGAAFSQERAGKRGHIVTTTIEHPAVLSACAFLEQRGHRVTYVRPNNKVRVEAQSIAEALEPDTYLITMMLVNNEVGTIQPVAEVAGIARERGILMHCDGVQGVGKMSAKVSDLGVDLFTFTGHKFSGPKGCGALYIRDGVELTPISAGGKQEQGRRGGTENVAGIVGFGKACELAGGNLDGNSNHVRQLRERLLSQLGDVSSVRINGDIEHTVPHIANVCLVYVDALLLMLNLSQRKIFISVGSACASGKLEPSYVLHSAGMSDFASFTSVRFSLGPSNTPEEADEVARNVSELAALLRQVRTPEEIGQCDENCPCLWQEGVA